MNIFICKSLYWRILFLILKIMKTESNDYNPVRVYKAYDYQGNESLQLGYLNDGSDQYASSYYCAQNVDVKSYVLKSDSDILKVTLVHTDEKSNKCKSPVTIYKESYTGEPLKGYQSFYGFYVLEPMDTRDKASANGNSENVFGTLSRNQSILNTEDITDFPYTSIRRIVDGQSLTFFKLYESLGTNQHKSTYYQYTLSNKIVNSYKETEWFKIDQINEIRCNDPEVVKYMDESVKKHEFDQYLEEIESPALKNIISEHVSNYGYWVLAHLVPITHLLFDGSEYLLGNCVLVPVWKPIRIYILKVDKAIFNYVEEHNKSVTVYNGYYERFGPIPAIVWKMIIPHQDESDFHDSVDVFLVLISNLIVRNPDIEEDPFNIAEGICEPIIDCEEVNLFFEVDNKPADIPKEEVVKCCKLKDKQFAEYILENNFKNLEAYEEFDSTELLPDSENDSFELLSQLQFDFDNEVGGV